MPKHKGIKYKSEISFVLEEPIEFSYKVVGYPEWINYAIPASLGDRRVFIQHGHEEEGLAFIKDSLRSRPVIGLDSETGGSKQRDGLNPRSSTSRMLLLQIGNRECVWIFQPELVPFLKDILEDPGYLHLNQNIVFDYEWLLAKYGIHVVRMFCTMLAEQVLRAGLPGYKVSLLDMARVHPPCRLISKQVRNQFVEHSGIFTEEQLYYAGRDVFMLFDIFDSQNSELKRHKLATILQLEFQCIAATAEMELTGVYIDTDLLMISIAYWESERDRLEQEIMDVFNAELRKLGKAEVRDSFWRSLFGQDQDEVFDLDSAEQKLEALRRIGLTLENVQRATLKTVEHQLAKLMVEHSEVTKLTSTYGRNLIEKINPDTGRLHPEFRQLGIGEGVGTRGGAGASRDKKTTIATGRFSSDFQILPRAEKNYVEVKDPAELAKLTTLFQDKIAAAAA